MTNEQRKKVAELAVRIRDNLHKDCPDPLNENEVLDLVEGFLDLWDIHTTVKYLINT